MQNNLILRLKDITARYDDKTVLSGVNLDLYEHDFLGIIGPNGGGKTTLLKLILGLKKPSEGSIEFFQNGEHVPAIRIGYLPQYNQIDRKFPMSVFEVILSGLNCEKSLFSHYTNKQKARTKEMLAIVGLEELGNRPIGTLSGGQIQRALLGRALVSDPQLLILDEPNTYIDKRFEGHLYHILGEVNKRLAIILVSHDIGSVLQNVKSIACVSETLDYHPATEISGQWLEHHMGCPIDLIGHGNLPHRLLKYHTHP